MTKKGIVDPWRVVEPLVTPARVPPPKGQKISPADVDLDFDLRQAEHCVFRSTYGSLRIQSKTITEDTALDELVQCLFLVLERPDGPDLFERAHIGFTKGDRIWNNPRKGEGAAYLSHGDVALYFLKQNYDEGMRSLIGVLKNVNRMPGKNGAEILKRCGVTLLIR